MKWWSVDTEILYPSSRVSGSGSISTLALSEDEGRQAEERRGPLGFAPAPRRNWGEGDWTAHDLWSGR